MINQENQRRRNPITHFKPSSAIFLTLVVCFIMSISMVSAFEFDNIKYSRDTTFDGEDIKGNDLLERYNPIEIKNNFGLGKKLFEVYLSQHDDVCGEKCKSTIQIKLHEDGVLIDDIIFETLVDESWVEQDVRSFQFSYWGDVDDYEIQCVNSKPEISENGTVTIPETCTQIKTDSNKGWVKYNIGDEVKKGIYELKLDAEKDPSKTVDWKIITQGKLIGELAIWGGLFSGSEYQLSIAATGLDEAGLEINGVVVTELGSDLYKINTTNADDEVSRALIMKTLFYGTTGSDPRATSQYINATEIYSRDSRDEGKRGLYTRMYIPQNNGNVNSHSITFDNTVDNYNVSSWSIISLSGFHSSANTWEMPTSTILLSRSSGGTSSELGTDTSADEKDNPASARFLSDNANDANDFRVIVLTKGNTTITTGGGLGSPSVERTTIDFYLDEGFPEITYSEASIILNSPENNHISQTNEVQFNCSAEATGGATIENISLWTNSTGVWNSSSFILGEYDTPIIDDSTDYSETIGGNNVILIKSYNITGYKYISHTNYSTKKDGYTATMYNYIDFNYEDDTTERVATTHTGNYGVWTAFSSNNPYPLKEVKSIDYSLKYQYTTVGHYKDISILAEPTNLTETITDTTLWTCQACDSDGDCGFATENRTICVDTNAPTISIESPVGILNYGAIGNQETLNVTFNDSNLDSCWYNYNGTNVSLGCLTGVKNSTTFTLEDNYNMTIYTNDSIGNKNSSFIEWSYKVLENNRTHNSSSFETARETFSINLTANSSLLAVTLNYNGTEYTTTQSGDIWSYSMDIPTENLGNNSIYWKFTYGDTINSYTSYQNINETIFTLCNATYSDDYLNITFKDEADLAALNASITTSTFEYYLGSGTVTKTYNLINNTDNLNYLFCATPNKTLHVNPYVQYKRNADYPQRIWDAIVQDYTSSLTNQILYLLESADGIYVTIQIINSANQLISGVDITATREIGGEDTIVAFGTTGDAGTVTFWLNPDFSHTFDLSKTGYTDYQTSLIPTQTSYTITMGGAAETENSTIQGVVYSTLPTNSYLVNDTSYTFGFTLTSSYWDVSDYGFDLRLANGTIITGDNTGVEGTALTKSYNVNNQSIIYMDYYWVINGEYTNSSKYWIIQNTENTQWSIAVFFTDLNLYIDSGIYGLDNFGRNLIIFLILFLSIGIMSYKYGATSPLAVSSMMFGVIFFFDVVELIPAIRGVEHLLTYLSALILTLTIFNEVRT